ncbi:MAG: hypothetical protein V4536_08580 [Pseudomonadota bacterium]
MSFLISKIECINQLEFQPLRSKVIGSYKACTIEGTTVVLGNDRVLYCSGISARGAYTYTSRSMRNALQACIKMQLLTQEAVNQHLESEKLRGEARDNKWYAECLEEKALALGITLTKAQLAKLAKARGEQA